MTLREIMKLTPLGKAAVLAGAGGLDREVLETNIIEVPDTVRWMRGGEVVFSAGYAFGGDSAQGVRLLKELCEHGITALALKPGKYMPSVPREMIAQAEALDFPLLELPPDMPYSTCVEAIFEQLRDSRISELRAITNLHMTLLEAEKAGGADGICEVLAEKFGRTVCLWNRDWLLRYGDPALQYLSKPLSGMAFETGKTVAVPRDGGEGSIALYCLPVLTNTAVPQAYLTAHGQDSGLTNGEIASLHYAASLIGMELLREEELEQQYIRLNGTLLDTLLEGHQPDRAILRRQAERYQVNLDSPYIVFAARRADGLQTPRQTLWQQLYNRTGDRRIGFLMTENSICIIGTMFFSFEESGRCRAILEEISGQSAAAEGVPVRFGLSRVGKDLDELPLLVKEAEDALKVMNSIAGCGNTAEFSELGVYRVLCDLKNSQSMQAFCRSTLGSLVQYDEENDGELVMTLQKYFENDRNLRKTADAMFLHKNSVSYRMHKIEELTGRRLSDPQFQLELQLCIQYRRLL